ncbi:MAG: hypothetical protein ACK5AO_01070 [bacterium]
MQILRFIFVLLLFPICSFANHFDTGRVQIDIRRVKLHEDIDGLQKQIVSLGGGTQHLAAISKDQDLDLLYTDVYTRQLDLVQHEIEDNPSLDHRIKVKYLTGLTLMMKGFIESWQAGKIPAGQAVVLFSAYKQYMDADLEGNSILPLVLRFPYDVNRILIGDNTVFFENKGLRESRSILFKQFASDQPLMVLANIDPYLEEAFADSLIISSAHRFPEQFYNYAAAVGSSLGKKIRTIDDTLVSLIATISEDPSGRLIFPFMHSIMKGRISVDSVRLAITNDLNYYRLLIKTQSQYADDMRRTDTPVLHHELMLTIKKKAESLFINEINALHDEQDEIRFKILTPLTAEELYYIIVTGEEVLYTSSYVGVYNRLMARTPRSSGDDMLMRVRFDRFKKFIRMAAGYNKLDAFLSSMSADNAKMLMKAFVRGLEKNFDLEDAVDVADSYSSIKDVAIRKLVSDEIDSNLEVHRKNNNRRGETIYGILQLLFRSASDSAKQLSSRFKMPSAYRLPFTELSDPSGRVVQQVFFYGDKDGAESFANFMSSFRGRNEWKIDQHENWVEIRSLVGKPVSIFANLPLDNSKGDDPDAKAQSLLIEHLGAKGLKPSVVIHRGHSYHLKYTLGQLPASARIVVLGSCGSFQNLSSVLQICPDAHIVSSKEVGTKIVNEPVVRMIAESLRNGNGVDWISMWKQLEGQFGNGVAKERFDNYIPPHKNLGALFIKAFNSSQL